MEKRTISHEELVDLQVAFRQQIQEAYMKVEGIDRAELLYRIRMGIFNAEEIKRKLPPELHPDKLPIHSHFNIQFNAPPHKQFKKGSNW